MLLPVGNFRNNTNGVTSELQTFPFSRYLATSVNKYSCTNLVI